MTLTATDRCDRCGAQAYALATLTSGTDLLFCAHHWREHGATLLAQGATIHDETAHLATSSPHSG